MRSARRALTLAALALGLAAPAASAAAPLVSDVLVRADTGTGEPQVHLNPGDPAGVVVGENDLGVSYSRDGGATWKHSEMINPGDNVLAVAPDGTFFYSALDGDVRASRDGGETWEVVGNWVGTVAAQAHAQQQSGAGAVAGREVACNAPEPAGPVSTDPGSGPGPHKIGCDRPWLVADAQTGRLYASFTSHDDASGGEGSAATPWELGTVACRSSVLTNPAFECGRQYVSASGDGGRTWSRFQPMDSADAPATLTGGFSGGPVAAHGVLATGYLATQAPGATCAPCLVFETSTDDGATWSRHVVPWTVEWPEGLVALEQSFLFEPYVAADPSRPGRYAVMVLDASQTHLLVFVTADRGRSWEGPARIAEAGDGLKRHLPWIAYGPGGALGAVWKTTYAGDTFAAWAAVAPAGDTRFAPPVRLSSEPSPGPVSALAGDDASDLTLSADTLYGVWGDRREGSLGIHLGRYHFAEDRQVQRICTSRRRFEIHLVLRRGERMRSADLRVGGRRIRGAVRARGRRVTVTVDLRGRPRGAVRVVLRVTTTAGRRRSTVRTYRACAPRRA